MNAIDTNILAYLFDLDAPQKQNRAQRLLDDLVLKPHETVWLWQVAVEFVSCLRKAAKKGRLAPERVPVEFRSLLKLFALTFPTAQVLERGFALHERYSLSHWDSLLLAACKEVGVTCLYSEDMQHGADYDGVKIINPFV
ncbi:MAG: PIN domain-containing protein [Gemmataceae bacterium]